MIQIITDSAADFSPQELQQHNILCIPLSVTFGERTYMENIDLSKDQFYALLATEAFPVTSQAAPQVLIDLFTKIQQSGDEAVYITLSSALSGTYQNAVMAKNLAHCDRCHIVDSRNATGGQRILVEEALRLRAAGKTAHQIVEAIEALRGRIVLYACMDTLENLYKGGRISHTVYALGNMAQIKPIIHVSGKGSIEVPAKAMGMRKGMAELVRLSQKQPRDENYPFYCMYTNDRGAAEALAQKLEYDCPIIQVGAAIGTHVGPNACGFVYVARE